MTESCSDRLYGIVNSVLKAADCDSATYFAKITRAHRWITFCLFKGKINNNTNIQTNWMTASCNNSQYCRRSRWIFAKYYMVINSVWHSGPCLSFVVLLKKISVILPPSFITKTRENKPHLKFL